MYKDFKDKIYFLLKVHHFLCYSYHFQLPTTWVIEMDHNNNLLLPIWKFYTKVEIISSLKNMLENCFFLFFMIDVKQPTLLKAQACKIWV